MVRLGEPVLDVVRLAAHVEPHLTRPGVTIARLVGRLDAVIGRNRVDAVGHSFRQVFRELPRCPSIRLVDELSDRKLTGAVDADEQVELALAVCPSAMSMWKKPIG